MDERGVNSGKCLVCDKKCQDFRQVKRDPCCGFCSCPPGFHTNEDKPKTEPNQLSDSVTEKADIDLDIDTNSDGNPKENKVTADAEIHNDSSPDSPSRKED